MIKSQETIPSIARLFLVGGLFLIFLVTSQLITVSVFAFYKSIPLAEALAWLQNPPKTVEARYIYLAIQGFTALGAFGGVCWIYLSLLEKQGWRHLNTHKPIAIAFLWVVLITIFVMPFTSHIAEWNIQMKLPAFMKGFEKWAWEMEEKLKDATLFLTDFHTVGEYTIGFLVIALIPALGEELLFRGILQRNFAKFLNPHVAIWLTAGIFSAIHLQFYGFLPRMMLGALFGYIYFWSGNIWLPIVGHFTNNAFTLILIGISKQLTSVNIEESEAMPLPYVITSIILTSWLLFYFRKTHQINKSIT
jgi:uncharacterized protein